MLARVKAFRFTILAQVLLLAVCWLYRGEILLWWLRPLSELSAGYHLGRVEFHSGSPQAVFQAQLQMALVASWVLLTPILASEAWRAGMRWAKRPDALRYHHGFALASWCVVLSVALLLRHAGRDAFAFALSFSNLDGEI